MSDERSAKVTEALMKFAEFLKFGRSADSDTAHSLHVSANGTTSVPPETLAEIPRARFAELHDADAQIHHDVAVGHKFSCSTRTRRVDLAAVFLLSLLGGYFFAYWWRLTAPSARTSTPC
jgi:hypothetical protein